MSRFWACLLLIPVIAAGCLLDSDDGSSANTDKKTLILKCSPSDLKYCTNENVDFEVSIYPSVDPEELLLWEYTGPDSTERWIYSANKRRDMDEMSFPGGEYTLKVSLIDSLDMELLGFFAPDKGSASVAFSVRDITVDIQAETSPADSQHYTFTAISPEQAWIPPGTDYRWTFGDDNSANYIDSTTVTHDYALGGKYQVQVILAADIHDSKFKNEIARDSLMVSVASDITEELELAITPQDTTVSMVRTIAFEAEPDPYDYQREVTWRVDYGEGEPEEFTAKLYEKTLQHMWTAPGTYNLDVTLYDPDTGAMLAHDSAVVRVDNEPFLHAMNYLKAYVEGYTVRYSGTLDAGGNFTEKSTWPASWGFGADTYDLTWNGFDFYAQNVSTSNDQTTTRTLSGTVAEDLSEVVRLEFTRDFIDVDYQGDGRVWTRYENFVLEHVPLPYKSSSYYNSMRFNEQDTTVGQYLTDFESWEKFDNLGDVEDGYTYYGPIDWQNTEFGVPLLTVEFKDQ